VTHNSQEFVKEVREYERQEKEETSPATAVDRKASYNVFERFKKKNK
jgi:hypothetical protein